MCACCRVQPSGQAQAAWAARHIAAAWHAPCNVIAQCSTWPSMLHVPPYFSRLSTQMLTWPSGVHAVSLLALLHALLPPLPPLPAAPLLPLWPPRFSRLLLRGPPAGAPASEGARPRGGLHTSKRQTRRAASGTAAHVAALCVIPCATKPHTPTPHLVDLRQLGALKVWAPHVSRQDAGGLP